MDITVHIPGIERLAAALESLATKPAPQIQPAVQAPVNPQPLPPAQTAPLPAQPLPQTQYAPPAQAYTAPITPPLPAPLPTKQMTFTIDHIVAAASSLADISEAHRKQVLDLMARYGVAGLYDLPQEAYPPFITELRGLGAKI